MPFTTHSFGVGQKPNRIDWWRDARGNDRLLKGSSTDARVDIEKGWSVQGDLELSTAGSRIATRWPAIGIQELGSIGLESMSAGEGELEAGDGIRLDFSVANKSTSGSIARENLARYEVVRGSTGGGLQKFFPAQTGGNFGSSAAIEVSPSGNVNIKDALSLTTPSTVASGNVSGLNGAPWTKSLASTNSHSTFSSTSWISSGSVVLTSSGPWFIEMRGRASLFSSGDWSIGARLNTTGAGVLQTRWGGFVNVGTTFVSVPMRVFAKHVAAGAGETITVETFRDHRNFTTEGFATTIIYNLTAERLGPTT